MISRSRVFIPAAGLGSRIDGGGSLLPKPLRSIGSKPLLTRVMDLYPNGTSFVIGLGFKASWVKQVATITAKANNQEVDFFETDSWEVPGKGLTDTVLGAQHFLQERFIFHAVDTLVSPKTLASLFLSEQDTIVVGQPMTNGSYRALSNGQWKKVSFEPSSRQLAYTGVALIQDYETFWKKLSERKRLEENEGEVLGIDPETCLSFEIQGGEWVDCGNLAGLAAAQANNVREDIVLERNNEAIWHIGSEMIKFHVDEIFIRNRALRATQLRPFVPEIHVRGPNTYSYPRENGITLSAGEIGAFHQFLKFLEDFWDLTPSLTKANSVVNVDSRYLDFYQKKTYVRVKEFLEKYPAYDVTSINDRTTSRILELLKTVNWDHLARVKLTRAHGDLHPDNILIVNSSLGFTLLDWRQDIAGSSGKEGDIYYDLAKIKHGLIVDHGLVAKGKFTVAIESKKAKYEMQQTSKKKQWQSELEDFISRSELDSQKVDLITSLIFLNIACLHHSPYDEFLFVLGHDLLQKSLKNL